MIDPGRPFGVPFADVVDSLERSLVEGVEQDAAHELVFTPSVLAYPLPPETSSVVGVSGLVGRDVVMFVEGRDYAISGTRLTWLPRDDGGVRHPEPGSRVQVAYRYRERPAGLTELNPGSVAGTLVRAVARELTLLYAQMDEAYRRAFLDTAGGVALDNVIALVGVTRNPAQAATGAVRFSRRRASGDRVVVTAGTVLEDSAGRRFTTTSEAVIEADQTEGDATVAAVEPGPDGNVNARTVEVMPTPPPGVDAVTNPLPITGGQEPEDDDAVRERARHALERAGNATVAALEFTVRDVDGIEDVAVVDRSVDPDLPLGEVRVRYSSAAGSPERLAEIDDEVAAALEATRAAGVLVLPERVRLVTVSGRLLVVPGGPAAAAAAAAYREAVAAALRALEIGEPLSLGRIAALAYQVPGLAELAEAQLDFARQPPLEPGVEAEGPVGDLLPVSQAEKIAPDDLEVAVVTGVEATAGQVPRSLEVRLLAGDAAVAWRDLAVHLRLQVKVAVLAEPTRAPLLVADVTRRVAVADGDTAAIVLSDDDLERYRPDEHAAVGDVTVSLAAFPAVVAATVALELAP